MPHASKTGRIEAERRLSQADFDLFARLSGDHNPIHVDAALAAHTRFGATVAHGMLLFSLIRGLVDQHYPGATLVGQTLKFPHPAYADDPLHLVLAPVERTGDAGVDLITTVFRSDGQPCLEGHCRLQRSPAGHT